MSSFSTGPSTTQEVLRLASMYLTIVQPSSREDYNSFLEFLTIARKVLIVGVQQGSLIITVECRSLEILEKLWEDYRSGHLLEITQKCLVTVDILRAFHLFELKLTLTIYEEEYRACQEHLLKRPGMNESSPSQALRQWGTA